MAAASEAQGADRHGAQDSSLSFCCSGLHPCQLGEADGQTGWVIPEQPGIDFLLE